MSPRVGGRNYSYYLLPGRWVDGPGMAIGDIGTDGKDGTVRLTLSEGK